MRDNTDPNRFMQELAKGSVGNEQFDEEHMSEIDVTFPLLSDHMYRFCTDQIVPVQWQTNSVAHAVFRQPAGRDFIIVVRNIVL